MVTVSKRFEGQDQNVLRVPFLIAIALIIAFGGGIWSTRIALDATIGFGAIKLGAWEAFPQAQTADADPYAKSHRANAGRLLLASAEGLTFTAGSDDAGAALTGRCSYMIYGRTPQARFWTLYATMPGRAAASTASPLPTGLNSRIALRNPDGNLQIAVSADAQPGNWLALPGKGNFRLVLTLYDTPTAGNSGLIDLAMPQIRRTGCAHG